jgi:probable rRNA maturation factor
MSVFLSDEQSLPLDLAGLRNLANLVLEHEAYPAATEVSVLLVSDEVIAEHNTRFMGREGPTDVLAFPIEELEPGCPPVSRPGTPPPMLGDVLIAPEQVRRQAVEHGVDFDHELALMVVHGMLHLMGYDHADEEEAVEMEGREGVILAGIGVRRP